MKLKSSNYSSLKLLSGLSLIIALLFLLSINSKKKSKYISAPTGIEQETPLDFIQITLSEKSYSKLTKKRNKAISAGVLETSDSDYVPATITFNGNEFRAEIRLKGDWTDHLEGEKWSFRIKLKDDQTILGMRKFSIHHPKTRGFINEWLYHKTIKQENLIGLRYGFLEGAIHIKNSNFNSFDTKKVGIYAIEETFDKRTIESNKRKESIILKFDESYFWSSVKKSIAVAEPSGLYWKDFISSSIFPITMFSEDKSLQNPSFNEYFTISKYLLLNLKESKLSLAEVFDIKKLAKQNAILNLFGAKHGNSIINLRFYYNPITSLLEPIAFDGNSGVKLQKYENFYFYNEEKDSIYAKELAYALAEVGNPEYLNETVSNYQEELEKYQTTLSTEFKGKIFQLNNLKHNQRIINKELERLVEKFNLKDSIFNIKLKETKADKNSSILIPEMETWKTKNIKITKESSTYDSMQVYNITRTNNKKNSFCRINNIDSNIDSRQIISLLVKPTKENSDFGLRIQGKYPDRVDAIYNLKKGHVKGVKQAGKFKSPEATITKISNGWFRCTLSGVVNTSNIDIIFGPTSTSNKVLSWESATGDLSEVNFVPLSIKSAK